MSHKARYVFGSGDDEARRQDRAARAMQLHGEAAREWARKIRREKKEQAVSDYERIARDALEHIETRINFLSGFANLEADVIELKWVVAAADGDVRNLANAVLDLQRQLRIEKASQATRGNFS